jgi:hypothetical protein
MVQTTLNDSSLKPVNNHPNNLYHLNPDVYLYRVSGIAQILDFNRGQFYALDALATLMLSTVLEKGFEAAVILISQTYDITEPEVRSDLTELLQNLANKQLLTTPEKSNASPLKELQPFLQLSAQLLGQLSRWLLKATSSLCRKLFNPQSNPNPLTVRFLLTLAWLSFRLLGWSRTLSLWQHWHLGVKSNPSEMARDAIALIDSLVKESAASHLFLPMVCKERALVGYHLLRTFYGLPAILKTGINSHPFQVHAWVECQGQTLTDEASHCELFIPITQYF